jgi:uroporphyrinogen decarboxylase
MTPRERWLALLQHQRPDRIPLDYWATPEVTQLLMEQLGCSNFHALMERLHVDYLVSVSPRYIGPALRTDTDVFGVGYRWVAFDRGAYSEAVHHPLAGCNTLEEIKASYSWPEPDWWDYSELAGQIVGRETYPVRGGGSEPFLIYKYLRGQEQAMIDLVEHPDIVHFCLDRLFELAYQDTLRILEALPGKVTVTYVAEDLGGQNNLLISPAHIREYLFPGMKRMIDLTHSAGAFVFHHDDGNITRILPELVDLGIDLLNPVQWRADGMDRQSLKAQYGARLTFHGAMDNQQTLPFGSVEDVRREVRENIRLLGEGSGYILAPCHNLQPLTPPENILAMYETAYQEGWYPA